VMTELHVGDSIHMRRWSPMNIFARDSCLTIVKIKWLASFA
jgi:hypothetical protein